MPSGIPPFFFDDILLMVTAQLNSDLSFPDDVGFYPDIQDGVRGYNTDRARGADTFVPFKRGIYQMTASTAMPLSFHLDHVQTMIITVTYAPSWTGLKVTGTKKNDGTAVTLVKGTNTETGLSKGKVYTLDVSEMSEVNVQNSGSNYASFRIEFE